MGYPAPGHRAPQHRSDVVLDQEIGKTLGTVPAGESYGHGGYGLKEKCLRHPEATPDIA